MAEKEIKITFAGEKLEALSFFLAEQGGKTVEELLKSHLDKSYEKNVPAQVRKFVESRMEPPQETANQEQESRRTGGTRQQRASGSREHPAGGAGRHRIRKSSRESRCRKPWKRQQKIR